MLKAPPRGSLISAPPRPVESNQTKPSSAVVFGPALQNAFSCARLFLGIAQVPYDSYFCYGSLPNRFESYSRFLPRTRACYSANLRKACTPYIPGFFKRSMTVFGSSEAP